MFPFLAARSPVTDPSTTYIIKQIKKNVSVCTSLGRIYGPKVVKSAKALCFDRSSIIAALLRPVDIFFVIVYKIYLLRYTETKN